MSYGKYQPPPRDHAALTLHLRSGYREDKPQKSCPDSPMALSHHPLSPRLTSGPGREVLVSASLIKTARFRDIAHQVSPGHTDLTG